PACHTSGPPRGPRQSVRTLYTYTPKQARHIAPMTKTPTPPARSKLTHDTLEPCRAVPPWHRSPPNTTLWRLVTSPGSQAEHHPYERATPRFLREHSLIPHPCPSPPVSA